MLIHYETNIPWKVCFSLAQRSSFQDSCMADCDDAQSDYQPTFGCRPLASDFHGCHHLYNLFATITTFFYH